MQKIKFKYINTFQKYSLVTDFEKNQYLINSDMPIFSNIEYNVKIEKRGEKKIINQIEPLPETFNMHYFFILFSDGYNKNDFFRNYELFTSQAGIKRFYNIRNKMYDLNIDNDISTDLFNHLKIVEGYKDELGIKIFQLAKYFHYFTNDTQDVIYINTMEDSKEEIVNDIFSSVLFNIYSYNDISIEFKDYKSTIKTNALIYSDLTNKLGNEKGYLSKKEYESQIKKEKQFYVSDLKEAANSDIVIFFEMNGIECVTLYELYKQSIYIENFIKKQTSLQNQLIKNKKDFLLKQTDIQSPDYLSEKQKKAIYISALTPIGTSIIVGGGGTGKTTIAEYFLKTFCDKYYIKKEDVLAVAFAGKAASVIGKSLKINSDTIDMALIKKSFDDKKLIIIDEAGMLSEELFYKILLRINPAKTKILLLGDSKQLPSIKYGTLLKNLTDQNFLIQTKLLETFRQDKNSNIIKLANFIIEDNPEELSLDQQKNIYKNFLKNDISFIDGSLYEILDNIIENHYFNDIENIQILTPMNDKGNINNHNINKYLQSIRFKDQIPADFYIGDKIVVTKNFYNKTAQINGQFKVRDLKNGELGYIKAIEKNSITIEIAGNAQYKVLKSDILYSHIELAYSLSVHKSQGSQWENVIFLIDHKKGKILNSQELFYTAITRAKSNLILNVYQHELFLAKENIALNKRTTILFKNKKIL